MEAKSETVAPKEQPKENSESDFIEEKPIEVEIAGKVFKIKELDGEEQDKLSNKYISVNQETGNIEADLAKRNAFWLEKCVVSAPYEGFADKKPSEKLKLLQSLKPKIRVPLLQAISKINTVEGGAAKNFKTLS